MKLNDLAEEYLKYMLKSYSESKQDTFHWEEIRTLFPDESIDNIRAAYKLLKDDNYVGVSWYDNVVHRCQLTHKAIKDVE